MSSARNGSESSSTFSFSQPKLKDVFCIRCKRHFFLREFLPLRGLIPLLLECGHVVCEQCAKLNSNQLCTVCDLPQNCEQSRETSLPLNLYTLGLVVASHNRPVHADDADISFLQPSSSKQWQKYNQGFCHECGNQATVRCPQCAALYCSMCYSKIHGKALQSHSKVMLSDGNNDESFTAINICSEICCEPLGYYCKNCETAGCSHCMLRLHPKHDYVSLIEKNEEELPRFYEVYDRLGESLQRICQAQKKVKSAQILPSKLQNSENVEASIAQHFAYLHGVLQNIERKITDQLYQQRNSLNNNLDEIALQLGKQEDQLQTALLLAASVKDNLDKVDVRNLTRKLEELADIPCHLVQDPVPEEQKITFDIDKMIIPALEKHCSIKIPPISGFSLVKTESLPDDYEMEPLTEENNIQKLLNKTPPLMKVPSPATMSSPRQKFENNIMVEGSSEMVHLSHIVSPTCFYIQKVSCQNELTDLSRDLNILCNRTRTIPTEIMMNKLYIIQRATDKTWCRGRVIDVKTDHRGNDTYNVFLVDYGMTEENVPTTRMRNITPQFAMSPVLAIKCALFEIVPKDGKWHQNAIEIFTNLVSANTSVFMYIHSICGDTYYVDLCTISQSGLTSIRDSLIFLKYASQITPHKLMKMNPESIRKYFKEQLELEKYTDVQIQFIESPHCIYVQKIGKNMEYIYKMMQRMTEDYEQNMSFSGYIYEPEKGLPCAARGLDGFWYRGIICDIPTESTVKVFYVDLGYTLILNHDMIRTLISKYMNYRCQSIKVSLRHIKPLAENYGQWNPNAIDFMKDYLGKKQKVKIIAFDKSRDTYNISLYVGSTNLASLLIKKGLAQPTNVSSQRQNIEKKQKRKKKEVPQRNRTETSESNDETTDNISNVDIAKEVQDPFKIQVLIEQIESPDCIYVADVTCEQPMMKMMAEMQKFYNTYHSEKREAWKKDNVCAVYSTKDKCYCRSRILEVKSAKEVLVFFYDMGIQETVEMKDIQPLHPKFSSISAYLFKVKLAGILPCGGSSVWPSLSCEKLSEILLENQSCKFYISKIEDDSEVEDSAIPVELWIKQSKMDGPLAPTRIEINSVNRMLVEKGVALPIKDYAYTRDKILAIELKRQLKQRLKARSRSKSSIKWYKICDKLVDNSLLEQNLNENMPRDFECSTATSTETDDSEEESIEDIPLPPKLSAWIPPASIMEDKFIGIPTYLDHDGFLYLHSKKRNAETLKYIEEKLEEFYKISKKKSYDVEWKPEDICIAQYHGNKKWYRAKVRKVLQNDTVEVEFVDYGNVEECAVDVLRRKVILGHIPIQCTKCIIHGLIPDNESGKWTTNDLDKIHSLVVEQECEVTVVDRTDTHLVISLVLLPNSRHARKSDIIFLLTDEFGINIKQNTTIFDDSQTCESNASATESADVIIEDYIENSLRNSASSIVRTESEILEKTNIQDDVIISGHSLIFQETNVESDNEEKEFSDTENLSWQGIKHDIISSTPQGISEENLLVGYKSINIPRDVNFIEIEMSCSISATQFYAQLKENEHCKSLNAYHIEYQRIMADIQENASKQPKITNIAPQVPCCAKFIDNLWYRCLILEAETFEDTEDVEIKLLYVDFGNDEYKIVNTKEHELYSLKEEWLDLPTMAVKCQLWNVQIVRGTDHAILLPELEKLYNTTLMAKIKESGREFMQVELYENEESKETVYNSLIQKGLFKVKTMKLE